MQVEKITTKKTFTIDIKDMTNIKFDLHSQVQGFLLLGSTVANNVHKRLFYIANERSKIVNF